MTSDFVWALICSTSTLMLAVSSSSMGTGGFYMAAARLGKGIWLGSLRGESLGTLKTYSAANHLASKPTLCA